MSMPASEVRGPSAGGEPRFGRGRMCWEYCQIGGAAIILTRREDVRKRELEGAGRDWRDAHPRRSPPCTECAGPSRIFHSANRTRNRDSPFVSEFNQVSRTIRAQKQTRANFQELVAKILDVTEFRAVASLNLAPPPSINTSIQSAQQPSHRCPERIADPQKSLQCNWPTCLDLLPLSRRKPVRNHVFLAKPMRPPQFLDAFSQRLEESLLIYHALRCAVLRAKVPRAD